MVKIFDGDIAELREIAESWRCECKSDAFGLRGDIGAFLSSLEAMKNGKDSALIVLLHDGVSVGIMGMVIFMSPIGPNKIANEHFWYVLPQHRGTQSIGMVHFAIEWAKSRGCSHIMMNASKLASELHDSVCNIYARSGMKHFETTYLMEV